MIKILIAEDSNVIQKILKDVLAKQKDFEIVGQALNGEDAVKMALKLNPDVIIMDYRMPKMNGPQAIKAIMSMNPKPIMVFTSAEPADQIKQEVLGLGALAFMAKPNTLNYEELGLKLTTNIQTISRMKPAKRSY
ncbi:MAG TPA: response regulator [Candidatus Obscuribacterales bacterium]